jgi:hypothetical protein
VESSRDCEEIFLALTQGERNALKAVASGMVGTVSILQLGKLRSLDLVHHDGAILRSRRMVGPWWIWLIGRLRTPVRSSDEYLQKRIWLSHSA